MSLLQHELQAYIGLFLFWASILQPERGDSISHSFLLIFIGKKLKNYKFHNKKEEIDR